MNKFFTAFLYSLLLSNLCFSHQSFADTLKLQPGKESKNEKIAALMQRADLLVDSSICHDQTKIYLEADYEEDKKQNQILQLGKKAGKQQVVFKNVKAVQVYLVLIVCTMIIPLFFLVRMLRNEKKLNEELLEKTEKLKELNFSKDKFFSIIAHDLRNPFHTLFSYTNLLRNGLDEFSKEDVTQILSDLYDATEQGYNLLQNLLFWTRSQTDRIRIFCITFEMVPLIESIIDLARPNAGKKGQKLISSFENDCHVYADKDMISTILRNFIFNAIKFSEKGKTIRIELSKISTEIVVKVIDEGVGMDEEKLRRLFILDEHISTIGTAGELGSGLGLILCREFAVKNDGRIEVESKPGKGSVFSLILPCVEATSTNE
jgi:signal transduction histidine kinase